MSLPAAYYSEGGITIYHGDCRAILPELGKFDLVLTDPPYGIGVPYGPSYDDSRADYWPWMRECVGMMLNAGTVTAFTHRVRALQELAGWDWIAAWNKGCAFGPRVGNSPVVASWEPIFLYGIHALGTKTRGLQDVLTERPQAAGVGSEIGRARWRNREGAGHPAPKPVALFRRLLSSLSRDDGSVLDPFMGSGTTLVAAKLEGRLAVGCEIEERYCAIAAERLRQQVFDFGKDGE